MTENLPAVNLDEIEQKMLDLPQAECPVVHRFGEGLYIREVHIPVGAIALGHKQRYAQMNIFIQGRLLMLQEDGSQKEISAPMTFIGPPGRKVGLALEPIVWQNIYATEETDIDKLEEMYFEKSGAFQAQQATQITDTSLQLIKDDYIKVLQEANITHEQARQETENLRDQIPMPDGWTKTCIRDSIIDGKGVFATCPFGVGEIIAPARVGDLRTPVGRYTNHSPAPNAEVVQLNGDLVLVSTQQLRGCIAGGSGDEITIDYREALKFRGKELSEV